MRLLNNGSKAYLYYVMEVKERMEVVINLRTATALGITIAPEILYRADRLIR